jgi:hypothetical protein
MKRLITILILLVLSIVVHVLAAVPHLINYQGRLTLPNGNPVDSNVYAIKFAVYDSPIEGNELWNSNGFIPILVVNGLFSHELGSTNPIPDSLVKYDSLWLGISIDLNPEMTIRTKLNTVPFAFKALVAERTDTASHSLDRTVSASDLVAGTLDSSRFSAYDDLVSEGKIGNQPNQIAAGDHSHPDIGMGIIEDTTSVSMTLLSGHDEFLLKTITIPANTFHHFVRVYSVFRLSSTSQQATSIQVTTRANGQIILSQVVGWYGACRQELLAGGTSPDSWVGPGGAITIDRNLPLTLTVTVRYDYDQDVTVTISLVRIEYDLF